MTLILPFFFDSIYKTPTLSKLHLLRTFPDPIHIVQTNYMNLFERKINEAEVSNKLASSRGLSGVWLE